MTVVGDPRCVAGPWWQPVASARVKRRGFVCKVRPGGGGEGKAKPAAKHLRPPALDWARHPEGLLMGLL